MKRVLIILVGFIAVLVGVYYFIVKPEKDAMTRTSEAEISAYTPGTSAIQSADTVNHAIVGEIPAYTTSPFMGESVVPGALQTQPVSIGGDVEISPIDAPPLTPVEQAKQDFAAQVEYNAEIERLAREKQLSDAAAAKTSAAQAAAQAAAEKSKLFATADLRSISNPDLYNFLAIGGVNSVSATGASTATVRFFRPYFGDWGEGYYGSAYVPPVGWKVVSESAMSTEGYQTVAIQRL